MPSTGVPASAPVAGVKVTPVGGVPDIDNVGVGVPVAVTVRLPKDATENVAVLALVILGATPSVNVRLADML